MYIYVCLFVCAQDPDYCIEIEADHPEFRKLAFTSPGPKNAFAPLQRSGYGRQHQVGGGGGRREEATEAATTTAAESKSLSLQNSFLTEHYQNYVYMYM